MVGGQTASPVPPTASFRTSARWWEIRSPVLCPSSPLGPRKTASLPGAACAADTPFLYVEKGGKESLGLRPWTRGSGGGALGRGLPDLEAVTRRFSVTPAWFPPASIAGRAYATNVPPARLLHAAARPTSDCYPPRLKSICTGICTNHAAPTAMCVTKRGSACSVHLQFIGRGSKLLSAAPRP